MEKAKESRNQNDYYYEELDLFELIRKMWKWKFLTLVVIIIFMLTTFFFIKSTPETYTSKSIIKIGKIASILIEQIPDIQTYIESGLFLETDGCLGKLKCSPVDKLNKDEDKIIITSTNFSPEKSFSCIQKANENLLKRHSSIYKKAMAKINENIASIKTKEVIDPVYFLESYTYLSTIIKNPEKPVEPDSKKTVIKLTVAFFASLFIGIFLSFFIEYILMHKKENT